MNESKRHALRSLVRYVYDAQKLRIQSGNRTNKPNPNNEKVRKNPPPILSEEDKESLGKLENQLYTVEKNAVKEIAKRIEGVPVWEQFLKHQTGCGPTMAGVLIAWVNIEKSNSVSALWRFCGLGCTPTDDSKTHWIAERKKKGEKLHFNPFVKSKIEHVLGGCLLKSGLRYLCPECGHRLANKDKEAQTFWHNKKDRETAKCSRSEEILAMNQVNRWSSVWFDIYQDYRHRKETQMVPVCMSCKGSGTINIQVHGEPGKVMDKENKKTITCPNCKGNPGPCSWGYGERHRHQASVRYMMKMFLMPCWITWRKSEGLPIREPYAIGKLHMAPHSKGDWLEKVMNTSPSPSPVVSLEESRELEDEVLTEECQNKD